MDVNVSSTSIYSVMYYTLLLLVTLFIVLMIPAHTLHASSMPYLLHTILKMIPELGAPNFLCWGVCDEISQDSIILVGKITRQHPAMLRSQSVVFGAAQQTLSVIYWTWT